MTAATSTSASGWTAPPACSTGRAKRSRDRPRLRFGKVNGPALDVPDDHVDVVISFLSFRYLDWDPVMAEIRRVLVPGGRLWVVDMVQHPVRVRELGVLARSAVAHLRTRRARPQFAADLATLTDASRLAEYAAAQPDPRRARVSLVFRQPIPRYAAGDADGHHDPREWWHSILDPWPRGRPPPSPTRDADDRELMLGHRRLGHRRHRAGARLGPSGTRASGAVLVGRRGHPLRPDGCRRADRSPDHGGHCARRAGGHRGGAGVQRGQHGGRTAWRGTGSGGGNHRATGWPPFPKMSLGPIGVVGGRRTIAGGHYRRGLARPGRVVLSRVAQPLSAHIEAGRTGSPQFLADLARIVAPLRGVDALVLACTHYPAASRWFAAALPHALLIDPAERLAAAMAARYPHTQTGPGSRVFLTTGDPDAMRAAQPAPGVRC